MYRIEEEGGDPLEAIFLEIKNSLIDKAKIFIPVFLLLMVFSIFWMYTVYTGGSYEEKQIPSYTQQANYTYKTPVTKPNPLYPQGTFLEMGQPAYFFSVTPTQDISFKYSIEGADSADLNVGVKSFILTSGKEGEGEEQKIFWQKGFPIGDEITAQLKSGEPVISNFNLDVVEMQSKAKEIQDQLNYTSDPTIEIVTTVNYEGKINGEDIQGSRDFIIPVNLSSTYYQMPEELGFSEDTYKSVKVKKEPSLLSLKFPLSLFLLSTVILGGFVPLMKMGKVHRDSIKKPKRQNKNSPFKDLISTGKLPEEKNSLLKVEISSLKDLVDAAIDMNERVIYDPGDEAYFIIHSGIMYIFLENVSEEA